MDYNFEYNARAFTYLSSGELSASPENNIDIRKGDRYILFYITTGSGVITADSNEYKIKKGQSFLVFPLTAVNMQADITAPWGFKWLEIKGSVASWLISKTEFKRNKPVLDAFCIPNIEKLFDLNDVNNVTGYGICRVNGKIFELLSYYIEYFPCISDKNTDYVFKAREYIQKNYRNPDCSVQSVANQVKLERTYLYRLFKKETGMSIIEYINKCRVSEAKIMLIDEDVSVKDVALCVGFVDQMYFSRVFKKIAGQTPTEYRKSTNDNYKEQLGIV